MIKFDNNILGGNSLPGSVSPVNRSLNNLLGTCDPRDQLAQDIRMFNQSGVGDIRGMLQTRLGQIDCRNQEAQDIRSALSVLGPNLVAPK